MSLSELSPILRKSYARINMDVSDEEIDFWHRNRYEVERGWRDSFRDAHQSFIDTIVIENPDWVKERRVEYLNGELLKVMKEIIFFMGLIVSSRGQVYQWLGDMLRDECLVPLWKRMIKIKRDVGIYELAPILTNQGVTTQDIELAKECEPDAYLQIIREENGRAWALCPFHKETKPSFCWYRQSQSYYCYGCNQGGDLINLIMELYELDFIKAIKYILKKV